MMRVDLHVHTTASDGQHTPSEVVSLASSLDVIAITDHDTTEGIAPARAAAAAFGRPLILPGIELSTVDAIGDVHLLGYMIDPDDLTLQAMLRRFRDDRFTRGQAIVARLNTLGVPLTWEAVAAIAGEGAVGRPHIARGLVALGVVESVREAFEVWIGEHAPAYVARERLTPEAAINLVHGSGGVAVLAHPGSLGANWQALAERLIAAGLDGIEVNHPSNGEAVRLVARALAARHDLLLTGGSDFHGLKVKPHNALGCEAPPIGTVYAISQRARWYGGA